MTYLYWPHHALRGSSPSSRAHHRVSDKNHHLKDSSGAPIIRCLVYGSLDIGNEPTITDSELEGPVVKPRTHRLLAELEKAL